MFAYPHDKAEKFSGHLLLDPANHLSALPKRCYIDYLDKKGFYLSRPRFNSFRDFVVQEIKSMSWDYGQAFFQINIKKVKRGSLYLARQVIEFAK